jgi:hypothetical protein
VDAPKDVVVAKPGAFLAAGPSAEAIAEPPDGSGSFDHKGLSSFDCKVSGLRDGYVVQPNGFFDGGLQSFDLQSFDGGQRLAGGAPDAAAGSGGGCGVLPVFPPMQLFQGLFGRALPDSAWASDHCLVTAAIALQPAPPEQLLSQSANAGAMAVGE